MGKLFYLKAKEAYEKCKAGELANEIWNYKHPGEEINCSDREYNSWQKSLPEFLGCVLDAGLEEIYVVFEMKTPVSNKAMDVLLVGYADKCEEENRILIVELKQWSSISVRYVKDPGRVYIREVKDYRRHPLKQLHLYENNLQDHHSGIQKMKNDGKKITFSRIAYLHNFENPAALYAGIYKKWETEKVSIFGRDDKNKLIRILKSSFLNRANDDMIRILEDYEAVLGNEGLAGLKMSYKNQASLTMMKDQQKIVEFVKRHLLQQLKNPHKEIIVISGGPGTGKTIVGIRFILEYVNIFNNGKNDNQVIFCLPKSKTVKAMFDAACAVDEEYEKEYCCYLHEIACNQNLVVADEAHRITDLKHSLDEVFRKGTKLLILLQDDHQILRPGEEGTYSKIKEFAESNHIPFSPADAEEKNILTLIDEKRCDDKLLRGLKTLLYDDSVIVEKPIENIKIFDQIENLEKWKCQKSINSRTKYILPFCWPWKSRNHSAATDISIGAFEKTWNPEDTEEQIVWLNDPSDDRAACIYTSQGLDMDNVAFIWWDDLKWNEEAFRWEGDLTKLEDPSLKNGGRNLRREEVDLLIINTYYVMMTRPRYELAIWFKDIPTKKHVSEVLGLVSEEEKERKISSAG